MRIINKYASYEYTLFDRFEAGIVLLGYEVKSVKLGRVSLKDGFVKIVGGELLLLNVLISPYAFADNESYEPKRTRKLLMHKKEILKLSQRLDIKRITLVPTAIYTKKGKIKLEIALAKGKMEFEKRETIRKKDLMREQEKILKNIN